MTNPVTPFRNDLFGSRGMDIKAAMDYAEIMINTYLHLTLPCLRLVPQRDYVTRQIHCLGGLVNSQYLHLAD